MPPRYTPPRIRPAVEELLHQICRVRSLPPPDAAAIAALAAIGEPSAIDVLQKISSTSQPIRNISAYIRYMVRQSSAAENSAAAVDFTVQPVVTQESACFSSSSVFGPAGWHEDDQPSTSSVLQVPAPLPPRTPPPPPLRTVLHMPPRTPSPPPRTVLLMPPQTPLPPPRTVLHMPPLTPPPLPRTILQPPCIPVMAEGPSPQMIALGTLEFRKAFLILSYLGRNKLETIMSINYISKLKDMRMDLFEEDVWNKVDGISEFERSISEFERRKNLDCESGNAYVYHCHVDRKGIYTLKGPYLQPTRTHMQRVLGDDNILLVKFAEGSGEKRLGCCPDEIYATYHSIAREGILVGLRRYRFFVFKDGGKEDKKKNPTSSAVKCYFIRTESGWLLDQDTPYLLRNKSIQEARNMFMHVHTVSSLSKYMARFSLILSKTINLDIDFSSVNIKCIEDVPCMDGGCILRNKDGELLIHTDGTGLISEDLSLKCPTNIFKGHSFTGKVIQGTFGGFNIRDRPSSFEKHKSCSDVPPLLIQFRLFHNGSAVKGTVLVDKRLPPNTICVRPSMIKVMADPTISNMNSCNSFEIVGTSNQPKRTSLSRQLIALLHLGGVPKDYFLELVASTLDDAQSAHYDIKAALRVAVRYGDMNNFLEASMISCGIPLNEPYLQNRLSILMREDRKGLMGGKLPVTECYYLMGTADPTGKLMPNQVCVILDNGHVSGEVLVYKHPGLHPGDIHKLTAVYVKDIETIIGNAKYAIFFPTTGPRSLADEMANSDFDGDMYWVSRNPTLLRYFTVSKPWQRPCSGKAHSQRKPSDFSCLDLEKELFHLFLNSRFKPSYAMGTASDSWMAFMDRLLTLPDDCAEEKQTLLKKMNILTDIYYDALDAPKSGAKVEVPKDLKAERLPHFLERKDSYHSSSVLGLIYDKVRSFQILESRQEDIWQLPCFREEAPESCMKLWRPRYDEYLKEMSLAMRTDEENKDMQARDIINKYKSILYEAANFEQSPRRRGDILNEALAIYQLSYRRAGNARAVGRCSFAWSVAGDALCKLHSLKQGESSEIILLPSILRQVLG